MKIKDAGRMVLFLLFYPDLYHKKTPAFAAGVLRVTRLWFEIYNLISVAALMITSATAFGCEMKTT